MKGGIRLGVEVRSKAAVFVVSDSAGDTGEAAVRAAAAQFDQSIEIHKFPFLQNPDDIDRIMHDVVKRNGIIVSTLVISELKDYLIWKAKQLGVTYIDLLGPIIRSFEQSFQQESKNEPGMIHKLDEGYFKKVEAVEFAVKYDDGRDFNGILHADVVLVGVSRTSKTPLTMYLAHKCLKVANVPLVPEVAPPDQLFKVSPNKIVGLRIDPAKLNVIRTERLKTLGLPSNAAYANVSRILAELEYAESVMKRIGCPVIDVSDKAVEETASIIIEWFRSR